MMIVSLKEYQTMWEEEKTVVTWIFPFHTVFSNAVFLGGVLSWNCVAEG